MHLSHPARSCAESCTCCPGGFQPIRNPSTGWCKVPPPVLFLPALPFCTRVSARIKQNPLWAAIRPVMWTGGITTYAARQSTALGKASDAAIDTSLFAVPDGVITVPCDYDKKRTWPIQYPAIMYKAHTMPLRDRTPLRNSRLNSRRMWGLLWGWQLWASWSWGWRKGLLREPTWAAAT